MKRIKTIARRFVCTFVYLTASDTAVERFCYDDQMRILTQLTIISLAWGCILAWLWDATFHITWTVFRILNWVIPSVLCAAAITLGLYRKAMMALVKVILGDRLILDLLGAGAIVLMLSAVLNYSFHLSNPDPITHLPQRWQWLWPRPLCRMLITAPLWGAWSMIVLVQFHRPDKRSDSPTERFARSVKPVVASVYLVIPFAMTLIFLKYLPAWQRYIPPMLAAMAALGGGTIIKKRIGFTNREVLLANNFLTQLALLIGFLIVR